MSVHGSPVRPRIEDSDMASRSFQLEQFLLVESKLSRCEAFKTDSSIQSLRCEVQSNLAGWEVGLLVNQLLMRLPRIQT